MSIVARTSKFEKGLKRARKKLAKFGRQVTKITKTVARIGTVASAAALGGLTLLTRQSFKTIAALAKTSDKLGISTEKLVAFRVAAERTGVSTRSAEMGLQRMTRRVSEAAKGSGVAVKALAELGLSAEVMAKSSPDEQFAAIAEAMKTLPSEADRVRLAFALFDSEGVALKNTLALGADGLAAFDKHAEKLGLTLGRVDARKVEMANDSIADMKDLFVGIGNQIAVNVAPLVHTLAEQFISTATAGEGIGSHVKAAMRVVVASVALAAEAVNQLKIRYLDAQLAATRLMEVAIKAYEKSEKWIDLIASAGPTLTGGAKKDTTITGAGAAAAVAALREEIAKLETATPGQNLIDRFQNIQSVVEDTAKNSLPELNSEFKVLAEEGIKNAVDEVGELQKELDDLLKQKGSRGSGGATERGTAAAFAATQRANEGMRQLVEHNAAIRQLTEKQNALQQRHVDAAMKFLNDPLRLSMGTS